MLEHLDAAAARRWALTSLDRLVDQQAEIDGTNVYPIADGDTGTNLVLTVQAGVAAVEQEDDRDSLASVAATFARGTLLGARGNSGVILSQLLRGWADVLAEQPGGGPQSVSAALRRGADQAYAAVSRPVEGTMLSIARAAADGARGSTLAAVVTGAATSARAALARTPDQLDVLARAGVVDAGGRGLLVLLEALAATVTADTVSAGPFFRRGAEQPSGRRSRRLVVRRRHRPASALAPFVRPGADLRADGPAYEVMYLLDAKDHDVPALRTRLDAVGNSLVIVGGGGLWNVHVHTDDVGAAVEAGIAVGRPHRVQVTRFGDDRAVAVSVSDGTGDLPVQRPAVAVVATASGRGLADLLTRHGAHVVHTSGGPATTAELLEAVRAVGADSVVVLPDHPDTLAAAQEAASAVTRQGLQVAVLPTRAAVQALAALAVHDGAGPRSDDLVRMAAAAAATRHGAVTVADSGSGALGSVDGQVVETGDDPAAVAVAVAARMLADGGELLTLVCGAAAGTSDIANAVSTAVREQWSDVEVTIVDGGQPMSVLLLGVE